MRKTFLAFCGALIGAAAAQPTSATKADSGWVSLFNGTDLTGLYDYVSGTGMVDVNTQTNFTVQSGMIHVNGSPGGYLGTIRQYSHYHVRVDYQWPVGTVANANSGLLIHLDSAAIFSKAFTTGGRPRSIEVNCRRDTNFPWSLWSADKLGPYITTTVTAIPAAGVPGQYNPAGVAWTDDPWGSGNTRVLTGDFQANPELPVGQWNRGEAYLYGDSGTFVLNGQIRTRGHNFQTRLNAANASPRIACTKGNIGLQSEGFPILFRNFEIMELDSISNVPVHARRGCTDRRAANYDPRGMVDDGSCTPTALAGKTGTQEVGVRFLSNTLGNAWIAFPPGSTAMQLLNLSGRPVGVYPRSAAGSRLPAGLPRGVFAVRFLP